MVSIRFHSHRLALPRSSRGSVLVVVLWASVGLVSIALLFGHSMLMNYRGADNDLAGRQADQAIEGAVRYARSLFLNLDPLDHGVVPDPTSYESEAVPVGEGSFWFMGRSGDEAAGGTRVYALVDEASKLNVNTAPKAMLDALETKGMTPDLSDAIVQERDPANAGTSNSSGAKIKGLPFESVEELALLVDATAAILYGEDTNQNGFADPNETDGDTSPPADNSDTTLDAGILEYLTVFTREPMLQKDGTSNRIDVTQLTNPGALGPALDMLATAFPDRDSDIRQKVTPGPYPSVIDFFLRSGVQNVLSDGEFDQVAGNFKTPDPANPAAPALTGLINVNTATATVLGCVIGKDAAEELVAERTGRGYTTGIAWAARLLAPVNVGPALAYLTGDSYQMSADVAAVGRHGRGYRRTRLVIDTNKETNPDTDAPDEARIIYRRNLAPLGWALGPEVRQQLALKKETR